MQEREISEQDIRDLITGTRGGLSVLHAQAILEGLIPQDMGVQEFADLTRAHREKLGSSTHLSKKETTERRQSRFGIANLFKGRNK